ncbi:GNAT family N-acetyltransferase [Qipengyuania atrilutea]|uniref:GNAT family N-acetyltransferase n=1 Tax=Qipengyuania atrilutea TaxID=2744473 RepID=A0A850H4L0_9SPHN|nr:GNAT family N-acetyltransferase [Actirhodobacter atriluteus]NVD45586.1 GNAT family N-acetyltransferase [Actirhodobacter atriluteus]
MFYKSERLFLRPVFAEDWQAIYRGIAEEQVVRNLATAPWPYREEDAQAFVALKRDPMLPNFSVLLPGSGLIGQAGLGIEPVSGDVQIGYWIARPFWGRGFAAEAARGVIEVARSIGHRHLVASHFLDNPASGRVLEKAGFTKTGTIRPGFSLARGREDPVADYAIDLAAAHASEEDVRLTLEDYPRAA